MPLVEDDKPFVGLLWADARHDPIVGQMVWTKGKPEPMPPTRLLGFATATPPCSAGVLRIRCADDKNQENEIEIRLRASQARELAQELLKLALEIEATVFDLP